MTVAETIAYINVFRNSEAYKAIVKQILIRKVF